MTRYVIDAPTLLHLVDNDLRADPEHQLVAPKSIHSDALAHLLDEVVAGRRTDKEALAAHTRMTETKMRLLGDRGSRDMAWRIARQHGVSLREAEHMALVRLQADALVSIDEDLRRAADGVVPLAPLDALAAGPARPVGRSVGTPGRPG